MNRLLKLFKAQQAPAADVRDISDLHSSFGQQVLEIYERSFPEAERDPVENIAASLSRSGRGTQATHLRALVEQDVAVGFTYFSSYKEDPEGWFVRHALEVRQRARRP